MAPFRQNLANVTTGAGGQQGIVGRGGNFQALGAAAQNRANLLQRANGLTVGGGGQTPGIMPPPPSGAGDPATMPPSDTQTMPPPPGGWPGGPQSLGLQPQVPAGDAPLATTGGMISYSGAGPNPPVSTFNLQNPQQAAIAQRLQTLQSAIPQEPFQNPGFGQMPTSPGAGAGGAAAGVGGASPGAPPAPPPPAANPGVQAFQQAMQSRVGRPPQPKPVGQRGPANLSQVYRGAGGVQPKPPAGQPGGDGPPPTPGRMPWERPGTGPVRY